MARTGKQYLEALKANPPNLWYKGERVTDPTTHPVFRGITHTLAQMYEMQHDERYRDRLTYEEGGRRYPMSLLPAKTPADLARRSAAYKVWADANLGMMGRSPDYLNAVLMAYEASAEFFGEFADNVRRYVQYVRENDLATTHCLTNPQVNRAKSTAEQPDPYIPVGVVKQLEGGIVVRGARMLSTLPTADELLVFPSTLLKEGPGADKYAVAFAIPTNTPGLHFICREGLSAEGSAYDYPLSSRLEEMDCLTVFDDVFVPWERVFVLGDLARCNNAYAETGALMHMAHQVVVLKTAKTEAFLGLISLIGEAIGADAFPHVQEKIAEVIVYLEAMRGFWARAELEAKPNRYGLLCPNRAAIDGARNLFPRLYPRIHEIVQQVSASGLITLPSEADFDSPMGPYLEKYLQSATLPARERVQLFRLAWDMTLSGFGARQELYERFFFGDPVRMYQTLFAAYDKEPYKARIREFLGWKEQPKVEAVAGD
ncbi:4-hydroxyphenylacetate 3-monooxygenase, oxygenase component [Meiothermus granaticius]|uniref:4-hydroxyphenylacetate 3-monooxygenase oxygenase component n=1 Tax=Meiothermus granaticius NBRC 107808 TaxID=1227551 RepID=A0A399FAK8_9DEIN|nr:4-hydroxyphenylacetate 3-monooxygenase, oxygenase component [Meiothermus granaticius]RIH93677.1 4-hydroxyphenylacetate 3-monooxygenase oxygenase component [Meiothermus granaticius NBRC 107808]GEM86839.1 4-hydroxyphenylacetate 3-monooxygenase oxygenase component [Meiothermus granaticius NBRC 107808]